MERAVQQLKMKIATSTSRALTHTSLTAESVCLLSFPRTSTAFFVSKSENCVTQTEVKENHTLHPIFCQGLIH